MLVSVVVRRLKLVLELIESKKNGEVKDERDYAL